MDGLDHLVMLASASCAACHVPPQHATIPRAGAQDVPLPCDGADVARTVQRGNLFVRCPVMDDDLIFARNGGLGASGPGIAGHTAPVFALNAAEPDKRPAIME